MNLCYDFIAEYRILCFPLLDLVSNSYLRSGSDQGDDLPRLLNVESLSDSISSKFKFKSNAVVRSATRKTMYTGISEHAFQKKALR